MTQPPHPPASSPSGPRSRPTRPARRRALVAGAVVAVALAVAGAAAVSTRTPDATGASGARGDAAAYGMISAHRGGQWGPDNSLKAFRGALVGDVRDIEGDVFFTTDGVAVFGHDDALSECGVDRTITGSSWSQIEQVRCSGEPLARLGEVAAAFRTSPNRSAILRVELKHPAKQSAADARDDARRLVSRLVDYGVADRSIFQDFRWRTTADTVHSARKQLRLSCLESDVSDADVETARSKGCYDVSYDHAKARDGLNEAIHAAGMRVAVWTVDSPGTFARLRDEGADVIITDSPEAARGW